MTRRTHTIKPQIEDIEISQDQLDRLEKEFERNRDYSRHHAIRKILGYNCTICGQIPVKKVIYKEDGGDILEYYCEKCFSVYRNQMVRILATNGIDETVVVKEKVDR